MAQSSTSKAAGAFDIRNVIGALMGIYGIVLILAFFFVPVSAGKNSADNLWSGIAMVVVAVVFMAWAKIRPIIVDESKIDESSLPGGHH